MLPKRSSRCVALSAAVLFMVIIIALCFFLRSPPAPEYVTVPVRQGNIENTVIATGRIDAFERVNVGAQVSGQVKSLKVKVGDRVIKGQPIAVMKQSIDYVKETLRLADTRYRAGGTSSLDVVDAQQSLLSQENGLTGLQRERLRVLNQQACCLVPHRAARWLNRRRYQEAQCRR